MIFVGVGVSLIVVVCDNWFSINHHTCPFLLSSHLFSMFFLRLLFSLLLCGLAFHCLLLFLHGLCLCVADCPLLTASTLFIPV
jgi:hypothetical protein